MEYLLTTSSAALATGWNPHLLRDAALETFGPKSIGHGSYGNFLFCGNDDFVLIALLIVRAR